MSAARLLVLALLANSLIILPADAHTIETTSHVTAATIFSDRALVTRSATVHLAAGTHTISVTDMPAGFDEATLRVQGKSSANVKIGTVEVKHVFLTEQANAAERDKAAAMAAKTDEKTLVEGDITALQAREQFINHIVEQGAAKSDGTQTKTDFTPEKWAQAWTLVQNGMAETQKDLATKRMAARKIDEDIAKLQLELNQVRTQQSKERREAHINYEASADADLDLPLTYQTPGAHWRPVYDARLDTGKGMLDLEQYGQVTQVTGEDWDDIDLTLSTAQPAYGSEMPRLNEWWVQLLQPYAPGLASDAASTMSVRSFAKAQRAMPAAAPMAAMNGAVDALKEEEKDLEPVQATVQSSEYSAEFHVPGHVAVKSVNEASKLFISSLSMKAKLASQTSPRLAPTAYLFAEIRNDKDYPFIPGTVSKYRDGSFIGNAALNLLRAGESTNMSFGIDDRVKVTFKQIKTEQSNPSMLLIGDMTAERQFETKVQNLHKEPIIITVFEQIPVTNDADVTVTMMDDVTTPGSAKDSDGRQGVMTWSGSYAAQEEKIFKLGFKVKYPKGKNLIGL